MNKPLQLNVLYIDKTTKETVRPTGFEELGGILKIRYHHVTNGLEQDMARFMPVKDFLATYKILQPKFKAPWVVHFPKMGTTVVTYNGKPVGHLSHLDVLYTRDGSPRIFMQVESPCVAIEDESQPCTMIEAVADMAREVLAESKGKDVPAAKIMIGDLVLLMTKLPQVDSEGNLTSSSQTYQVVDKTLLDTGYAVPHVELVFAAGGKIVLPASVPLYCIKGDET